MSMHGQPGGSASHVPSSADEPLPPDDSVLPDFEVWVVNLPASWPQKSELEFHEWGIVVAAEQIRWERIDKIRYAKSKTNGTFRLFAGDVAIEISFVSMKAAAFGLLSAMRKGVSMNDRRLAIVGHIAERAGLVESSDRRWVTLGRT